MVSFAEIIFILEFSRDGGSFCVCVRGLAGAGVVAEVEGGLMFPSV